MTVEERVDSICRWGNSGLRELVIQLLRDQIEDCAKVADKIDADLSPQKGPTTNAKRGIARTIGRQIRALAAPTENEVER